MAVFTVPPIASALAFRSPPPALGSASLAAVTSVRTLAPRFPPTPPVETTLVTACVAPGNV